MANSQGKDAGRIFADLQQSGFPFQIAVTQIAQNSDRWSVERMEYPWQDEGGRGRFLDFVATGSHCIVTVECKKFKDEKFTFLLPPQPFPTKGTRCIHLKAVRDSMGPRFSVNVGIWPFAPESSIATFCVPSREPGARLLEQEMQLLLGATEAYAVHQRRSATPHPDEDMVPIIPVFVTNAQLFVAHVDAAKVSLQSGQMEDHASARIEPVDFIRFQKAFVAHADHYLGEHTVFIVRAQAFATFLVDLVADAPPSPLYTRGYPIGKER